MTIGAKLKNARIAINLSQIELAEKVGITERTIYSYEQNETYPKPRTLEKLAKELNVTVDYLKSTEEPKKDINLALEEFLAKVKAEFGNRAVPEAMEVLTQAFALFAGGELGEDSKELFIQSIMEVYLISKQEAREKFTPKSIKRKRNPQ